MEKNYFKKSKIFCDEVKSNIDSILAAKCIFIQGMDTFQKDRAFEDILKILKTLKNDNEKSFLFYADEFSDKVKIGSILDILNMYSFDVAERLVTIKKIEDLSNDALKKLLKYVENPCPQSRLIMIYEEDEISYAKYKTIRNIKSNSLIIETKEIKYENDLSPIIDMILLENNLKMDDNTKKSFLNKMGTKENLILIEKSEKSHYYIGKEEFDIYNVFNEIKKLELYIGNKSYITMNDINQCTLNSQKNAINDLEDALGEKNLPKALNIVKNLMENENDLVMINGKIGSFFYFLWKMEAELKNGKNITDLLIDRKIIKSTWKQYAINLRVNKYKTFLYNYDRNKIMNALKQIYICDSRKKLSVADDMILMTSMIYGIIK